MVASIVLRDMAAVEEEGLALGALGLPLGSPLPRHGGPRLASSGISDQGNTAGDGAKLALMHAPQSSRAHDKSIPTTPRAAAARLLAAVARRIAVPLEN